VPGSPAVTHEFERLTATAHPLPGDGGRKAQPRVELRLSDPEGGVVLALRLDARDGRRLARLLVRACADARWDEVVGLLPESREEG